MLLRIRNSPTILSLELRKEKTDMKKYTAPELELEVFESEDVITVSFEDNEGSYPNGWN